MIASHQSRKSSLKKKPFSPVVNPPKFEKKSTFRPPYLDEPEEKSNQLNEVKEQGRLTERVKSKKLIIVNPTFQNLRVKSVQSKNGSDSITQIKQEFLLKMRKLSSDTNHKKIDLWQFSFKKESHVVFMRDFISPYFSNVFRSLVRLEGSQIKTWVNAQTIKGYLNLPELVARRVIKVMNPSGDGKIEHSEWLEFFFKLTTGSIKHRLHLAFLIFDI